MNGTNLVSRLLASTGGRWGAMILLSAALFAVPVLQFQPWRAEVTLDWGFLFLLALGIPLGLATLGELTATVAHRARRARARSLRKSRNASYVWTLIPNWWDQVTLRTIGDPSGPLLTSFYCVLLTPDSLEIWHGAKQVTSIAPSAISNVRVGQRMRNADRHQGNVARNEGSRRPAPESTAASFLGGGVQGVVELSLDGLDAPLALSVTGRNEFESAGASTARASRTATELERWLLGADTSPAP